MRGFKSIRALEDFELGRLNVLIGANGAGKSNFISLFDMLAAMVRQRLRVFVVENGGPDALMFKGRRCTPHIDVEMVFGNNGYEFSLAPGHGDHLYFREEATRFFGDWSSPSRSLGVGHHEARLPHVDDIFAGYAQRAIDRWRVYHFHDTSRLSGLRQFQDVRDNLILKPDASNLAPFLRLLRERYPDHFSRILDTIRLAAPFVADLVHRVNLVERIELEWLEVGDQDTPRSSIQFSDGTIRFICLATLLLQPRVLRPATIIIDEPELGLHPYAITIVGVLLQQASEKNQLIVSTQSADLISEMEPEDIVIVKRKDDASVFDRLEPDRLRDWLEDYTLGDLWKMNVLGGEPDW